MKVDEKQTKRQERLEKAKKQEEEREEREKRKKKQLEKQEEQEKKLKEKQESLRKSIKVKEEPNTDCKLCGEFKSVLIKCSRSSEWVCQAKCQSRETASAASICISCIKFSYFLILFG